MKRKTIFISLFAVIFVPLYVSALNTTSQATTTKQTLDVYTSCKKAALAKREQTMLPALKEYVSNSEAITNNAKTKFKTISWYIDTSYRINAKKIQDDRDEKMIPVNKKIEDVRKSAQATWKAEDSLCDYLYNKATTTPKVSAKKKK